MSLKFQQHFIGAKSESKKISMITCYDALSAKLVKETNIDSVLVGDSLGMVVHGLSDTTKTTIEMMQLHTKAVSRVLSDRMIVSDLPFLSFRKGLNFAMESVEKLVQAGAGAVKLEGVVGNEEIIEHIVNSGIPVMGHIGLTPQHYFGLGGYKVQKEEDRLLAEAKELQDLGAFSLVLECIPSHLAKKITESLSIPTIGIGAGQEVDGQILVWHDLLGLNPGFSVKFVRKFASLSEPIVNALNSYDEEIKAGSFPNQEESFK